MYSYLAEPRNHVFFFFFSLLLINKIALFLIYWISHLFASVLFTRYVVSYIGRCAFFSTSNTPSLWKRYLKKVSVILYKNAEFLNFTKFAKSTRFNKMDWDTGCTCLFLSSDFFG